MTIKLSAHSAILFLVAMGPVLHAGTTVAIDEPVLEEILGVGEEFALESTDVYVEFLQELSESLTEFRQEQAGTSPPTPSATTVGSGSSGRLFHVELRTTEGLEEEHMEFAEEVGELALEIVLDLRDLLDELEEDLAEIATEVVDLTDADRADAEASVNAELSARIGTFEQLMESEAAPLLAKITAIKQELGALPGSSSLIPESLGHLTAAELAIDANLSRFRLGLPLSPTSAPNPDRTRSGNTDALSTRGRRAPNARAPEPGRR